MWKPINQDLYEPLGLRFLKWQLANTKCDCPDLCIMPKAENLKKQDEINQVVFEVKDQFTQAMPETHLDNHCNNTCFNFPSCGHMSTFCPSCFVTLSLLQGDLTKFKKVLKDEAAGSRCDLSTADKSTDSVVQSLEKSTSHTLRPAIVNSILGLEECIVVDQASDLSFGNYSSKPQRKRSNREVTFQLDSEDVDETDNFDKKPKRKREEHIIYGCTCAEAVIRAISPPLTRIW